MGNINREKILRSNRNFILIAVVVVVAGLLALLIRQTKSTGDPSGKNERKKEEAMILSPEPTLNNVGENRIFLNPLPIGKPFTDTPQVSNLASADLDNDGFTDVIVCDTKANTVSLIRQYPAGTFSEFIIATNIIAPAHVQVADFDQDGDQDLIIAVLGYLFPNNDRIGSVLVMENTGHLHFKTHVIAEKIARVTDVRAGDLDGDGDKDLAVAGFGYNDGETRWIENLGKWKFNSHLLQSLSGPMNVVLSDIDKDGDLDIVSLVSQEWEEIYCFVNDGKGRFTSKLLWGSNNEDFGSSGIYIADIDKDGDDDILYTNGDSFNYTLPAERPWHGVQWLENKGGVNFEFHRLCDLAGAYNVRPADIDIDGDMDLFVISAFNKWDRPGAQSFIWLENTGDMHFKKRDIAVSPTHLITLDIADFNKDGLPDMVTGGMHIYPPYNRMGRVTLWMNNGALSRK